MKNVVSVFLIVLVSLIFVPQVKASISSCSVSVSPGSMSRNVSDVLNFTINNTSDTAIVWVKITSPSDKFSLISGATDWQSAISGSSITYTQGTLNAGNSNGFGVSVQSADEEVSPAAWTVEVSDDGGGASSTTCTGDTSVGISGDVTPPNILDISISDVTASSVKINWTTDEPSAGTIHYGTTSGYGSDKDDTTLATSHTTELDGLSANATYHYDLVARDASNNSVDAGDNTFVTASASTVSTTTSSTTTTVIIKPTTTSITVAAPTPTPDRTPPTVSVTTDFSKSFAKSPTISAKASDNKGVAKIEYSLDNGKNWLPVDGVKNLGALSVSFDFTPPDLEDGNYEGKVRATDINGNVGVSSGFTLVIDRLPPYVGGNLVSIGPQVLQPSADGALVGLAGLDQQIILSAVGGPTSIDLSVNNQMFSLVRNPDNELWKGTLSIQKPGIYQLIAKAVDGAGNKTERDLNPIIVVDPGTIIAQDSGKPLSKAVVNLYVQEPQSLRWSPWDGSAFGQQNPQTTNKDGTYHYFIPPGKYYLEVKAPGFKTVISNIFSVEEPMPLTTKIALRKDDSFKLTIGPFVIPLFDFSTDKATITLSKPAIPENLRESSLVNTQAPLFSLPTTNNDTFDAINLRGKSSVITFINTWVPAAVEQIPIIDTLVQKEGLRAVIVAPQQNASALTIFQKRGGYQIPIVVDQDGTLVEQYQLHSLPTHYFLDRKGFVRKIVTGVLNEKEINQILISY